MTIDRHRFNFSLTDLSICVLLGVVALLVRLWLALQLPFPAAGRSRRLYSGWRVTSPAGAA